jgi:predicted nucleic acid-binding Zn ribbon protein
MIRADRVIPAALAQAIRKAPLCPEKVEFAWRTAVGAAMDRVTHVRLDASGVLHVTTPDANWAREVKRSSRIIVSRMSALLGDDVIRKIAV